MVQDGLKIRVIENINDIEKLREYIFAENVKEVLKEKILNIISLIENINFDLISVYYENIIEEFEFTFFSQIENNSGQFSVTIRDYNTKIYIYGCKFLSKDLFINIDENLYMILESILKGNYSVKEIKCNNNLFSREVSFMGIKKRIEFGLFNFSKSNITTEEYYGKKYIE